MLPKLLYEGGFMSDLRSFKDPPTTRNRGEVPSASTNVIIILAELGYTYKLAYDP